MNSINNLHEILESLHLLKHPFYQAWSEGKLSKETLKLYAKQYYHHVEAFPRYISAIHSQCDDIESRQVLLGNLTEEEKGEENHPELWLRFAETLGTPRQEVKNVDKLDNTKNLVDGYFELARTSYAKGLGALYAYERQVPAVAESKISGLKAFYNIDIEDGLKFFNVHINADQWHSAECLALIDKLPEKQKAEAYDGAIEGAKLLWQFLDGIQATC
jgi:pyrroloquinoline-quinone synthase